MRVVQIVDSLRPGGAEQMAVSYANALVSRTEGSFLCCTRMEGLLRRKISDEVGYLFLEKKSSLDIGAYMRLRTFIEEEKINVIQAHSSSFFLAVLVKLSVPGTTLVWHDHYGRSLEKRKPGLLKPASRFFDGIIAVNSDLESWARRNLFSTRVQYLSNFLPSNSVKEGINGLRGEETFKIICLANLRPQKDHVTLLKAFKKVFQKNPHVSLHLIGKEDKTSYSMTIRGFIKENDLGPHVFFYGEQENINAFLLKGDLGILSSTSEGLPLALLEYGQSGLPVVCTRVGQCAEVTATNGKIVPPRNSEALAAAILSYIENDEERSRDAFLFQEKVKREFSEETVMEKSLTFLREVERQKSEM